MDHEPTDVSIVTTLKTRMGPLETGWRNGKLVFIHFGKSGRSRPDLPDDFRAFLAEMERYLNGEKVHFTVPLDVGSQPPFLKRVLQECSRIPYGVTCSYSELAQAAGNPKAARAAGQAMARNPIPIVIPCHRVLASNGRLGGYGGGLDWKRFLLKLEDITWKE